MNLTTQGTQDKEKQIQTQLIMDNTINTWTTYEPDNIGYTRQPKKNKYTTQLIMDNPMNLTTQGTQDKEKQIHNTINNGQPNEPDNIGYTRRRKTNTQHN